MENIFLDAQLYATISEIRESLNNYVRQFKLPDSITGRKATFQVTMDKYKQNKYIFDASITHKEIGDEEIIYLGYITLLEVSSSPDSIIDVKVVANIDRSHNFGKASKILPGITMRLVEEYEFVDPDKVSHILTISSFKDQIVSDMRDNNVRHTQALKASENELRRESNSITSEELSEEGKETHTSNSSEIYQKAELEFSEDHLNVIQSIDNGSDKQNKSRKRKRGPTTEILGLCQKAMKLWHDRKTSLSRACKQVGVDPKTVKKWIPNVLELVDETKRDDWIKLIKSLNLEQHLGKFRED